MEWSLAALSRSQRAKPVKLPLAMGLEELAPPAFQLVAPAGWLVPMTDLSPVEGGVKGGVTAKPPPLTCDLGGQLAVEAMNWLEENGTCALCVVAGGAFFFFFFFLFCLAVAPRGLASAAEAARLFVAMTDSSAAIAGAGAATAAASRPTKSFPLLPGIRAAS
jgi:hypothetical protein